MAEAASISAFNDTVYKIRANLLAVDDQAEAASISAFNDTVYKIRANLSAVDDQVEWLQRNVQDLVNNVDNASALLKPLFEVVIDVENAAECGFVGDAYQDTKSVMCSA